MADTLVSPSAPLVGVGSYCCKFANLGGKGHGALDYVCVGAFVLHMERAPRREDGNMTPVGTCLPRLVSSAGVLCYCGC